MMTPLTIVNPEFKEIVFRASKTKSKHKKNIPINIIQEAITEIQKNNGILTLKTLAERLGCNFWNIRDDPELFSLLKKAQGQKLRRHYDNISTKVINEAIENIKKSGRLITVNEVGRQLNCTKFVFRNRPHLKQLIIKAKETQMQELRRRKFSSRIAHLV